ncbi:hypothetical protein QOZ80_6AG0513180 [Eleusine coracana subsp. coracana]|nr:hypothetical protein QOZ80_6AG0513180 [Eleusine coracana subsp. coracana]
MNRLLALALLVLLALPAARSAAFGPNSGVVVARLTHADGARPELLRRSRSRRCQLLSTTTTQPVRARVRGGLGGGIVTNEYLVHLSVGTPPQPVALTLDTGSDLVWTQCAPCRACFPQRLPLLDPAASSSYAPLTCAAAACRALPFASCGGGENRTSCAYAYHYGDKSLTVGQLATDWFSFDDKDNAARRVGVTFGCGHFNKGVFQASETGIAGFGRGKLSLPSQLNVTTFSYCFASMFHSSSSSNSKTSSSFVTLGDAPLDKHAHVVGEWRTTPLLTNPSQPSLYFLSLNGISVGSTRVQIPEPRLRSTTTIIDSGASITTLPEDVYEAVKAAFVAQVGLPLINGAGMEDGSSSLALDLCFALPVAAALFPWRRPPRVPKLTMHLDGADWEVPRAGYVFEDRAARVMCVVLDAAPGDQTVIGNFQQQDTHVVYDLRNNLLSFAPARCDRLAAETT